MADEFMQLSDLQMDALKEIGNIGAGNAATSLSMMINRRIEMSVPQLKILPFPEVAEVIGGAEKLVVGVYLQLHGEAPGGMLFVLPLSSALTLADMLMGLSIGSTQKLGEMEHSALKEVGNILVATYLNSLTMFTGLDIYPSVPSLATDMAGAILSAVIYTLGVIGDHALVIETEFSEDNQQVVGHLFFLPEPGSLNTILERLGVNV